MLVWLRRHVTAAGFLLTFALAWGALVPSALRRTVEGVPSPSPLALMLAGFAPAVAALLLTALLEGGDGLRRLWRRFADWRAGWRWYAVAYKGPTLVAGTALLVFHMLGGRFPPFSEWDAPIISTLLLVPLAGLGQETGWRAFLLPRLQERLGSLGASAVLGLGWGVWRLPFHVAPGQAPGAVAAWMLLGAIPLTMLFTWVWNRSDGRLLPVILLNASTEAVLTAGFGALPDGDLRPLMAWDAVLFIAALVVLVVEGPALGRAEAPAVDAPTVVPVTDAEPIAHLAEAAVAD